jgi:SAM-dependent methyltransferase
MIENFEVEYIGKDLEAMDFAENYHRWILDLFKPYLGKHLVEVGAGTGSFSQLLLETKPESLGLVEPSEMFVALQENLSNSTGAANIEFFRNIFTQVADKIRTANPPDTVIYINVLEHIEDDALELEAVNRTLADHGRVCIFVPSMPFLFSEFDKKIGHFRRYTKKELIEKCETAGFKIRVARYFDFLGILPWLVKYRLMRSLTMESGAVQLYDRVAVPIIKPLENLVQPPVGKNLLVVAEKI